MAGSRICLFSKFPSWPVQDSNIIICEWDKWLPVIWTVIACQEWTDFVCYSLCSGWSGLPALPFLCLFVHRDERFCYRIECVSLQCKSMERTYKFMIDYCLRSRSIYLPRRLWSVLNRYQTRITLKINASLYEIIAGFDKYYSKFNMEFIRQLIADGIDKISLNVNHWALNK